MSTLSSFPFKKALLALAVGASLTTSAFAQTATVNGVTFPVGFVPNGNQLQAGIVDESLITASGQTLQGVGFVSAITNAQSNVVWSDGNGGVRLAFVFDNYVSNVVIPPTAATAGQVTFTGGMVDFYTVAAGTSLSGLGTAGDIARIRAGNLFLQETAAVENATGATLISTIPSGSSLNSFSAASGFGFLNVVGGAAASYFNTNTFANSFDVANGGFSDLLFTSSFRTGTGGDFPIGGTSNLNANTVSPIPEPETYALMLAGLAGIGFIGRRRRREG